MSDELKIALVAEGTTDYIIIDELINAILGNKNYVISLLQPLLSEALIPLNEREGGWGGIYRWCEQTKTILGGSIKNSPLFDHYDCLIIHIDADVAGKTYTSANITDMVNDLPCEKDCPPPQDTVLALEQVLLRWIGETVIPAKTVFCIPSKSIEAWCLIALFPDDSIVLSGNIECRRNPEDILSGKPKDKRLVSSGKKITKKYKEYAPEIAKNFELVKELCSQANKFVEDLKVSMYGMI